MSDKLLDDDFKIDVTHRAFMLSTDSHDRDRTRFPGTNNFLVKVGPSSTFNGAFITEPFKDIQSIELTSAIIPDVALLTSEPYLVVDVTEFHGGGNAYYATNRATENSIAKLYFDLPSVGGFYRIIPNKKGELTKITFRPPLAQLSQLRISLRKSDTTLFDLGTDTSPPTTVDKTLQTSFTFKIVALIPKTERMGQGSSLVRDVR